MSKNHRTTEAMAVTPADVADIKTLDELSDASTDVARYVEQFDASWLKGVQVEKIVPLADGQGVRGAFLGAGGPVEISDPLTGEVRPLGTWRVRVAASVVIRLLDSARLRSDLCNLPTDGSAHVRIMRVGSVDTKRGRRVTDYVVGVAIAEKAAPL